MVFVKRFLADVVNKVFVKQEYPWQQQSPKEQPRIWPILTQFSISVFGEYGGSSV